MATPGQECIMNVQRHKRTQGGLIISDKPGTLWQLPPSRGWGQSGSNGELRTDISPISYFEQKYPKWWVMTIFPETKGHTIQFLFFLLTLSSLLAWGKVPIGLDPHLCLEDQGSGTWGWSQSKSNATPPSLLPIRAAAENQNTIWNWVMDGSFWRIWAHLHLIFLLALDAPEPKYCYPKIMRRGGIQFSH